MKYKVMKYKVGDKAKVRQDLIANKKYGSWVFGERMEEYKEKIVTIASVRSNYYDIEEDNGTWAWTDEMLEPVEEREKNNMNIEELNKEYKDKMDELMKEYKEKVKELEETKEEPFIKEKQDYFYIDGCFDIHESKYYNHKVEIKRIELGNCYPYTEENKEKVYKEVKLIAERRKLQSEMEQFSRLNNEEEIDWSNDNQLKWHLYVDCKRNNIITTCEYKIRVLNTVYFTSKEIAQKALEKFGDRIKELYIDTEKDN